MIRRSTVVDQASDGGELVIDRSEARQSRLEHVVARRGRNGEPATIARNCDGRLRSGPAYRGSIGQPAWRHGRSELADRAAAWSAACSRRSTTGGAAPGRDRAGAGRVIAAGPSVGATRTFRRVNLRTALAWHRPAAWRGGGRAARAGVAFVHAPDGEEIITAGARGKEQVARSCGAGRVAHAAARPDTADALALAIAHARVTARRLHGAGGVGGAGARRSE